MLTEGALESKNSYRDGQAECHCIVKKGVTIESQICAEEEKI